MVLEGLEHEAREAKKGLWVAPVQVPPWEPSHRSLPAKTGPFCWWACLTEEVTMRQLLLAFTFVLLAASARGACPPGSYNCVDMRGNQICKTFDTGQTRSIEGNTQSCPTGTHPWVDEYGNKTCKSFQGGQQYYDTSKSCPLGTYQWIDNWGNQVCKKF